MKTACVYHSIDLDGWMSAAIVKHWFKNTYPNLASISNSDTDEHSIRPPDELSTGESLYFIGYNYGQPIPDLSEYDKIIMVDISFPKDEMVKLTTKLVWIDHHISAINDNTCNDGIITPYGQVEGLRDTKFATCELAWKYFFPGVAMPELVRLLGRYGCFGHKGTDDEKIVLEFQYGARSCISNLDEAYGELINCLNSITEAGFPTREIEILKAGSGIYSYLCAEAKQVYKNGFSWTTAVERPATFTESKSLSESLSGNTSSVYYPVRFICINRERFNPINFGIDYHKDGYDGCACFHYDGVAKLWRFSLYNDNGLVDCSIIAKSFGGGGHKGAAGFVTDDLNKILR